MGVNAEADGFCPWCGYQAHPMRLVQHTWKHTVRREPDWWDSAGLVAMLVASVALIVVGVVGAS